MLLFANSSLFFRRRHQPPAPFTLGPSHVGRQRMELDDLVLRDRHEVPGKDQEIRELSGFDGTFGAAVGARFAALMVRPVGVFRTTFVGRPSAWGTCAEGQRALVVALIEDHVAITAAERVSCFPILRPLSLLQNYRARRVGDIVCGEQDSACLILAVAAIFPRIWTYTSGVSAWGDRRGCTGRVRNYVINRIS
jgi:hypothetical protein